MRHRRHRSPRNEARTPSRNNPPEEAERNAPSLTWKLLLSFSWSASRWWRRKTYAPRCPDPLFPSLLVAALCRTRPRDAPTSFLARACINIRRRAVSASSEGVLGRAGSMSARSLALYASSSSSSNVALAARPTLCRPAFRAVRRSSIVDVRGGWTVYRSPPSAPRGRHLTSPLSSWRWATSRALSGGSLPTGGSAEFSALLSAHQRDLVQRERSVLLRLHENLVAFGTDTEQLLVLRDVIAQMEELFMVCVVGEFNAGKSSFVNALLGGRHAEEGVLPTTAVVAILRHGERESRSPSLDASGLPIEVKRLLHYCPTGLRRRCSRSLGLSLSSSPSSQCCLSMLRGLVKCETNAMAPRAHAGGTCVAMVACDVQRFANSARDLIVEHKSQRRRTLLSLTTTPWRAALAFFYRGCRGCAATRRVA